VDILNINKLALDLVAKDFKRRTRAPTNGGANEDPARALAIIHLGRGATPMPRVTGTYPAKARRSAKQASRTWRDR